MSFYKVKPEDAAGQELSDLILAIHEAIADKLNVTEYRRKTRTLEDAFMVAAGHIVFSVAARRSDLNDVPIHHLISDFCAVIEMNAMEMHLSKERT